MQLSDLTTFLPGVFGHAGPPLDDRDITSVVFDSRKVESGAIFACIPGDAFDGHDFALNAVEAGAVALIVERPLDIDVPQIVSGIIRFTSAVAACVVAGEPSQKIPIIGVTGTNGKTTTVRVLADVLTTLGWSVTQIGTLTGARTTPEAPELNELFNQAIANGHDAVVMEVSSHALALERVSGTEFAVAMFTNLGVDHLDFHEDLEDYEAVKASLFEVGMARQAIVSTDTPAGARIATKGEIPTTTVPPKIKDNAELTASGSRFEWRGHTVDLPLAGRFNVTNAALAGEAAVSLGFAPADVAKALSAVGNVPGRFETIDEGQPFAVVVDYAHTPDGLEAVLHAARAITDGSLAVVFGAGGDRDKDKRPQMGEVAHRLADSVIVTNDNPRSEDPAVIADAIVAGMANPSAIVELDRRVAIRTALARANPGDVVVVAGKGHETTQTIAHTVVDFDDRVVVREELRRLGGPAQ